MDIPTNIPSDGKEKGTDFGKTIDALHNKQKLSSLRTYQGDMAEFIKEKNESVISIAAKEKKAKEEKEEKERQEQKLEAPVKTDKKIGSGFRVNLTMTFLSLVLTSAGALAFYAIFKVMTAPSVKPVALETQIIPYNNTVTLAASASNLADELGKISPSNGITIIKIPGSSGLPIKKASDFFNFLNISPPPALERSLEGDYVLGSFSQNRNSLFLIIAVDDYGGAFSAMLDWEENMEKDLSFLNSDTTASSTIFAWKDVIVKNKDTRGLVNEKGKSKIAYTFLDKNTILIVNDISSIGDIYSIYASRSVAR